MNHARHTTLIACALCVGLSLAHTPSVAASRHSETSMVAVASLVALPVSAAATSIDASMQSAPVRGLSALPAASAMLVVDGLEIASDGAVVVLRSAADGSKFGVRLSSKVVTDAGLAVGQTIDALAVASGHILVAGGRVLAMLPNADGRNLLYNEEVFR